MAHPTRFERVTFASRALLLPLRPRKAVAVIGQPEELTHLRLSGNVSLAFVLMQSNDAIDGVQFGWLD